MKKTVFLLLLVLCGASVLCAQTVLPGYHGYWEQAKRINIIDLIEFYPDQLPFVRNEIYARYGRPFVNKTYQDYFRAKSWYQEKSNFSESWLTQIDKENAEFIASVEQSARSIDEVIAQVLKNIEYKGDRTVLTFTSRQELVLSDRDVEFGPYGLNYGYGYGEERLPWLAMGDWILVYYYRSYAESFDIAAYKVNHASKRIIGPAVTGSISEDSRKDTALWKLFVKQSRSTPGIR